MTYTNNGKDYQVESVEYFGECINVKAKNEGIYTITECISGYTLFLYGEELWFDTFEEAYNEVQNMN